MLECNILTVGEKLRLGGHSYCSAADTILVTYAFWAQRSLSQQSIVLSLVMTLGFQVTVFTRSPESLTFSVTRPRLIKLLGQNSEILTRCDDTTPVPKSIMPLACAASFNQ